MNAFENVRFDALSNLLNRVLDRVWRDIETEAAVRIKADGVTETEAR